MNEKYLIADSIIKHITCYADILNMKVKSNQPLRLSVKAGMGNLGAE